MTARPERIEPATSFEPARTAGPSQAFHSAYSGDLTQARSIGARPIAEHGFPSSDAALHALGLSQEKPRATEKLAANAPYAGGAGDVADAKTRHRGDVQRIADDPAMDKLNRRNTGPYKSDSVTNDQMNQWKGKFDAAADKDGVTTGTLMTDMDKAAAAAGTNPDGSPRVSIGRARDQEGVTHYYAMFNRNEKQFEANEHAVKEGDFHFQAKDGTKAAIAEIGVYQGGTSV